MVAEAAQRRPETDSGSMLPAIQGAVAGDPGVLERIVTMNETVLSLYTPERKSQSRQWLQKGAPAPVKAKVQES